MHALALLAINQSSKFELPSFSCSKYMIGAYQNLNCSRDSTAPLSGIACHPWARTCYGQPTYHIWNLYFTHYDYI